MKIKSHPRTIVNWLGTIIIFMVLAHLLAHLLETYTGHTYGLFLFDLDRERNIAAFFGAVLLLSCSVLLALITIGYRQKGQPHYYWAGLSIIFLFLSLDEAAAIHENLISPVRNALNTSGFLYFAWVIPYALLFLVFVGFYARFVWGLPSKTRLLFIIGGGIFVTGAIGFELISGYFVDVWGIESTAYAMLTMFEELLEMCGITVFIYALLDYIRVTFPKIELKIQQSSTVSESKPIVDDTISYIAAKKQKATN